MKGRKILVIEDNAEHAELISDWFQPLGCSIEEVYAGAEAHAAALRLSPDLVILDMLMPEIDGWDVLKSLRQDERTKHVPIVIFSVLGADPENRIRGLRLGADYFLVKTAQMHELEAAARRALDVADQRRGEPQLDPRQAAFYFDVSSGTVWMEGKPTPIALTANEAKLLGVLYERRDTICTRDDIAGAVYGIDRPLEEAGVSDEAIDRLVGRLRHKIEPHPSDPIFVRSVRGRGFKLVTDL